MKFRMKFAHVRKKKLKSYWYPILISIVNRGVKMYVFTFTLHLSGSGVRDQHSALIATVSQTSHYPY